MQLRPCWEKTCSCLPSVGHATVPLSLNAAPPTNQRFPVTTKLEDMQLRACCGTCNWPLYQYNKNEKSSCNQVIRHVVACLKLSMQLGSSLSLDAAPSDKNKDPHSCDQVRRQVL